MTKSSRMPPGLAAILGSLLGGATPLEGCGRPGCTSCDKGVVEGNPADNLRKLGDAIATFEGYKQHWAKGCTPSVPAYIGNREGVYIQFAKHQMSALVGDTLPETLSEANRHLLWVNTINYAIDVANQTLFAPTLLPQPEEDAQVATDAEVEAAGQKLDAALGQFEARIAAMAPAGPRVLEISLDDLDPSVVAGLRAAAEKAIDEHEAKLSEDKPTLQ